MAINVYRFGVATLLCSLLAVATSASAECAWALWTTRAEFLPNGMVRTSTAWNPVGAFGNAQACNIAMANQFGEPIPGSVEVEFYGLEVEFYGLKDGTTFTADKTLAVKCLPDTVDPRGPEGE